MKKISYSFFLCFFMAGCSVGPRYIPPVAVIPSTYTGGNSQTASHVDRAFWWRQFQDPLLNKLIEESEASSLSLRTAKARVDAARADYAIAYAQLFPKVSADLLPPDGTGTGLTQVLALSAILEPDLFGKQRENRNRAAATVDAEIAEHAQALFTLQAEIASSYLELREAQEKERIFNNMIYGNRQVLDMVRSRYKSGLTSYLESAQQEVLIQTQLSDREQNKALILALITKLELLSGLNPGVLRKQLLPYKPVPKIIHHINLNVPSELLRRRADIIAAERRVAAAHANIRVAIANLFPQVNIGWLWAWQPQSLASNLLALQVSSSTLLGTFNAPLLNLTLYRIVDLRKREKALAVIQYELTIIRALHEVETQYNYTKYYKTSAAYLKEAVEKKKLVLRLAKGAYQKGVYDFNTILRSEEDLNRLELSYLHQVLTYQEANINLYKALGGGIPATNQSKSM